MVNDQSQRRPKWQINVLVVIVLQAAMAVVLIMVMVIMIVVVMIVIVIMVMSGALSVPIRDELLELASVCEEVANNIENRLTGG